MESIEWAGDVPAIWRIEHVPEVDDVRPPCCPGCRVPAKDGSRIVLHGHGVRVRGVVVAPCLNEAGTARIEECWSRRYRCTACRSVTTVLPVGVLPRYLYSALSIVVAFLLTAAAPYGRGLSEARAYALQGMYRVRTHRPGVDWRWRSLGRWRRQGAAWWPTFTGPLEGWLATLHRRAGSDALRDLVQAALASHVRWGGAM